MSLYNRRLREPKQDCLETSLGVPTFNWLNAVHPGFCLPFTGIAVIKNSLMGAIRNLIVKPRPISGSDYLTVVFC